MFDSGRRLLMAGLREGHEELYGSRLKELLFLRMYGDDFTAADRERIVKHIISSG
jgi:hypothetical protein